MRPHEYDNPDNPEMNPGDTSGEKLTPEVLVRRYAKAVFGICLVRTRSVEDAEDIMQEVFLKATGKLHMLRDPRRVREWLFQIARRTCIDHQRRRTDTTALPDDVPEASVKTDSRVERLYEAIAKLPLEYGETIALYYLDGRNCANVAAQLGITAAAARQRLARARVMLHDLLTENSQ